MSDTTATTKPRTVYRNIHVTDILKYRLPPAGIEAPRIRLFDRD